MRQITRKWSFIHFIIVQFQNSFTLFYITSEYPFIIFNVLIHSCKVSIIKRFLHLQEVWIVKFSLTVKVPMQPLAFICDLSIRIIKYARAMTFSLLVYLSDVSGAICVESNFLLWRIYFFNGLIILVNIGGGVLFCGLKIVSLVFFIIRIRTLPYNNFFYNWIFFFFFLLLLFFSSRLTEPSLLISLILVDFSILKNS